MAKPGTFIRCRVFLASVELFVTFTLAVSHHSGQSVPCGPDLGCEVVGQSNAASPFGIPLADVGVLVALTLLYASVSPRKERIAQVLSWTSAVIATLLTSYSAYVLHAICTWCVASNAILVALACAWSLGPQRVDSNRRATAPLATVMLLAGIWYGTRPSMAPPYNALALAQTPNNALLEGPRIGNGKRILVIFGTLSCSTCRQTLRDLLPGAKLNLYSIVWHQYGALSEETLPIKGLLWAGTYNNLQYESNAHGSSFPDIKRRQADQLLATRLGVQRTPTIFGIQEGKAAKFLWPPAAAHIWALGN